MKKTLLTLAIALAAGLSLPAGATAADPKPAASKPTKPAKPPKEKASKPKRPAPKPLPGASAPTTPASKPCRPEKGCQPMPPKDPRDRT